MAYEDGIKIKITAEDDASAAFEKVRSKLVNSFRDIDDAGDILSGLSEGIAALGVEFGLGGTAASRFSREIEKGASSASSMAAEIATMVSGLKDLASSGKTLVESGWFRLLFGGMAAGGGTAGGALGTIGTGAAGRMIAPVAAAGRTGAGVSAAGPLGAIAAGVGLFGIDWYTDSINKQQQRDASVSPARSYADWHEYLAGARGDIGEGRLNAILGDKGIDRLRGLDLNGDAFQNAVRQRVDEERAKVLAAQEQSKAQRDASAQAARTGRMKQAGMIANEYQDLAELLLDGDPLKLKEFQLRRGGMTDENQIRGLVQSYGDYLKQVKEAEASKERQLAIDERMAAASRRSATASEMWTELSKNAKERGQQDLAEMTVLFHTGQLGPVAFARNALNIQQQMRATLGGQSRSKPLFRQGKPGEDYGGAPLIESFMGGGSRTDQAQQTRKMTLDELKSLRRDATDQARENRRALAGIANKLATTRARGL